MNQLQALHPAQTHLSSIWAAATEANQPQKDVLVEFRDRHFLSGSDTYPSTLVMLSCTQAGVWALLPVGVVFSGVPRTQDLAKPWPEASVQLSLAAGSAPGSAWCILMTCFHPSRPWEQSPMLHAQPLLPWSARGAGAAPRGCQRFWWITGDPMYKEEKGNYHLFRRLHRIYDK